jgi:hypothetical protein
MRNRWRTGAVLIALAWAVTGCTEDADSSDLATAASSPSEQVPPATEARAVLSPLGPSGTAGTVRFGDARGDSVEVRIDLTGAPPGEHSVSLLPDGQCPAAGASGAASAAPQMLTTVAVGQDGRVSTLLTTDALSLERGQPGYVRGRPVVVGPPGAPVACGLVVAIGRWSES